jgi:hypothetical protein
VVENPLNWNLSDDTFPTKIGEFEIDEQGETKLGDGKVAIIWPNGFR